MLTARGGRGLLKIYRRNLKDDQSRRIRCRSIPTTHQTLRRMLPLRGGHFVEAVVHRDRA